MEPIYSQPYTSDEEDMKVKLVQSVHKIRRYNLKRKCQKKHKKLQSLFEYLSLNYSHQVFLKQDSSSSSSNE